MHLLVFFILTFIPSMEMFVRLAKSSPKHEGFIQFKKNSEETDKNIFNSIWHGIKRFLPFTSKANFEESYQIPVPELGYRYELRLVEAEAINKRHIITRILRYFKGINWNTAEDIVGTAIDNGVALVRVVNSRVCFYYLFYPTSI
jgi:hypothetical protein